MGNLDAALKQWLPRVSRLLTACALAAWAFFVSGLAAAESLPDMVEFNRDIRPILSDICYKCHGPDKAQRKADLRLDVEADALADRDGQRAIVPGDLEKSELYRRISTAAETERMPPVDSGLKLSQRQIELIRRWIEQGAKWEGHWSFIPPKRPPIPNVKNSGWAVNPIDSFVLARLEREGLVPSPEADRVTLVRRVTIDLTGIPPTPAEVATFLADHSPDAYDKLVDRLLASHRYGERMARPWLDAARYADTNGYQVDGPRSTRRWRDWVIDAFNANMPFDQFTVEQIAGDMLPGATLEQRIASGFNRNHRGNSEGGIIPEEYAVEYVVDRVETTATVWLGLTMGCARCHDHKYDPLTQREFYRMFAYFNSVPEKGRAIKFGNSQPMIASPTRAQQLELSKIESDLAAAQSRFRAIEPEIAAAQARWEETQRGNSALSQPSKGSITSGLIAQYEFEGGVANAVEKPADAKPVEEKFVDGESAFTPGRIGNALALDGRRFVDCGDVGNFNYFDKFSLAAWIFPAGAEGGTVISRMSEHGNSDGYDVFLADGKLQVNLAKRWLDDAIRVETQARIPSARWSHVLVTYDGSRFASGVKVYVDGRPQELKVLLDEMYQSFDTKEPLRIGSSGPKDRFRGAIDDVRVYNIALTDSDADILATPETIAEILALTPERRDPRQAHKLREFFLIGRETGPIAEVVHQMAELGERRNRTLQSCPTTMVMEEMPQPRPAFVLLRGQYDKPGEKVMRGVPECLTASADAPTDRLGLARWLVDPTNPLSARVAVNRYWQMYFGTGLVKTVDDFGAQGDPPTHPALLDWLATRFIDSGWDIKGLQRTIVTSATYRQGSRATTAMIERDPENRLLARGPRLRLSAEMIRDQALAASGLLVEQVGGPSVKPYQPDGMWKELNDAEEYEPDSGEKLYRRSMYTFWKRTIAPPTMITFDASSRETCTVRETRTNTPLQALTLMNETTFVEASRALAARMLETAARSPDERIDHGFRLVLARSPRAEELTILKADLDQHLAEYRVRPEAAAQIVSVGESRSGEKLDKVELAAYTAVASLIFNLDETITKE